MPSAAANAKVEKPAASEASDNSPVRQILLIIEHKIRNLEKRKSKLVSYRDLQKSGKELNADQKVAVAKYDEVAQTLEFARDLCKQVAIIVTTSERDAKKQAKRDARAVSTNEINKIRDVLCILDCLSIMGSEEARNDFLAGSNGAAALTSEDLRILDDIYPEVTPKHEIDEEGLPTFQTETLKAAEHLLAVVDSRPREVVGTTYARIKDIVNTIHQCGYFDRNGDGNQEPAETLDTHQEDLSEQLEPVASGPITSSVTAIPLSVPSSSANSPPIAVQTTPVLPAPAAAAVPAPTFPMMPVAPVTLQEVEHAYFSQQYAQQPRPITEVIGSQNFFFLQESELDSPTATPQPPARRPSSPNTSVQSQTFTNQSFSAPQSRHYPPELRSNTLMSGPEIQQHFPNSAGEVARGPPFPVAPMQIPITIPRPPLAMPPSQAVQALQSAQTLPVQVSLPSQPAPFAPSPVENEEEQQSSQPVYDATVDDNGWGDNNNTTDVEVNEWRESPETTDDRKDRSRGMDNRGPPKYRGGGRGRGSSRGGPPRNNYQNGRNGNPHYRNGEGYQNGGGNYRDNNQSGGHYRDRENQQGNSSYQGYKGRGRGAPSGGMRGSSGSRGRGGPRGGNRPHYVRKSPVRE